MSLSDKIDNFEHNWNTELLKVRDVKESVRELKEEMEHNEDLIHDLNQFQEGFESFGGIKARLKKMIDEVFGEELT